MQTTTSETHKDIFPPAIVPCKVQPMLPQIVVRRAFGLYVDKVRAARARVARGSDAQGQVSVVRHVVRELAEQRRAELSKGIYERKKRGKGEGELRCVCEPCCENRRNRRGCAVRSLDERRDACVRGIAPHRACLVRRALDFEMGMEEGAQGRGQSRGGRWRCRRRRRRSRARSL